jgi:hypothetical protein
VTEPRVWARWGMFAVDTGSLQYASAPGIFVARTGSAISVGVLGQTVTIFDTRSADLPFHPDRPDAPGFRVGPYYVAFNRGKA